MATLTTRRQALLEQDSIRNLGESERMAAAASISEVAAYLQENLGQRVTGYLSGVRDPKMVGQWASGKVRPRELSEFRLRAAYPVTTLLVNAFSPATAKAWFFGTNSRLDDQAPAYLLRHGEPPFHSLLPAAKAFVLGDTY
jgi:hypothetical protein